MTLNEQFHKFSEDNSKPDFNQMAQYVFEHCYLVANDTKYFLTEIEFYYHANGHEDEFCKKKKEQLKSDTLFFHYSGVDITFGCEKEKEKDKKEYGGILVRGIKSENKKESENKEEGENGPLRVLCALLNENTEDRGLHLKLVVSSKQERTYRKDKILRAARIGLSAKDREKQQFQTRPYRYFIKDANPKPKEYSKGTEIKSND